MTFIPALEKPTNDRTSTEKRLVNFSSLQYFDKIFIQIKKIKKQQKVDNKKKNDTINPTINRFENKSGLLFF